MRRSAVTRLSSFLFFYLGAALSSGSLQLFFMCFCGRSFAICGRRAGLGPASMKRSVRNKDFCRKIRVMRKQTEETWKRSSKCGKIKIKSRQGILCWEATVASVRSASPGDPLGTFQSLGKSRAARRRRNSPTRNLPKKDIEIKTENQTTSYHEQRRNVVSHKVLFPTFLTRKVGPGLSNSSSSDIILSLLI